MRPRMLVIAGSVCALSACVFDASVDFDEGALPVIRCSSTAECPPQWECATEEERCLPNGLATPVAPALTIATDEDVAVDIELCATALVIEQARAGRLSLPRDGVVTYTPDADFAGADAFTYSCEEHGIRSPAGTLAIDVAAVNDAPVCATPFVVEVIEDDDLAVDVVPCVDVDGDVLAVQLVAGPSIDGAAAELYPSAAGTALSYRPAADSFGTDELALSVSDGHDGTVSLTATVVIEELNDAPTAAPLNVGTERGLSVDVVVLGADVDGDALALELVTPPPIADASVVLLGGLAARVTPTPGKIGPIVTGMRVVDGRGGASDVVDVTVTVRATTSCSLLKNTATVSDGVEQVDPDGDGTNLVDVWCDQTRRGGGWTLVGVVDGRRDFTSANGLVESLWHKPEDWEEPTVAGPSDLTGVVTEPQEEARFFSYSRVPFTDVMIVARTPADAGELRDVVLRFPRQESFVAVMSARATVLSLPAPGEDDLSRREKWLSLVPGARLQTAYNLEGLLLRRLGPSTDRDGDGVDNGDDPAPDDPCSPEAEAACARTVRVGFYADDVFGQGTNPDSYVGVASFTDPFAGASCGTTFDVECDRDAATAGVQPTEIAAQMWLYVRDADFTMLGDAPSCAAHAARGESVPGTYLVANAATTCFADP